MAARVMQAALRSSGLAVTMYGLCSHSGAEMTQQRLPEVGGDRRQQRRLPGPNPEVRFVLLRLLRLVLGALGSCHSRSAAEHRGTAICHPRELPL
jgi:hypothetical protein